MGDRTPSLSEEQFVRIARALADPRRFAILEAIARAPERLSCGEIAARFPVAQPTVSHHLRVLAEADLIEVERVGQHHFYELRREVLDAYRRTLAERLLGT